MSTKKLCAQYFRLRMKAMMRYEQAFPIVVVLMVLGLRPGEQGLHGELADIAVL